MEMNEVLRNRLKRERLRLGLNQHDLGKKLGATNKRISSYEKGDRQPNYETLTKLADIFDCTTDYLLGRTDDRVYIVYSGVVDGDDYDIEINKMADDKPDTDEKFNRLVRKLKEVGFDVDKLMDNVDLNND